MSYETQIVGGKGAGGSISACFFYWRVLRGKVALQSRQM
jgi:hypothetical protein